MSDQNILKIESPQGVQTILLSAVQRRLRLTELLRHEGLSLNTRCGQKSLCDGCLVQLVSGTLVGHGDAKSVSAAGAPRMVRGCEYRVGDETAAIHLVIPARSLLAYEPQVVSEFRVNVPRAHDPIWQNIVVEREELSAEGGDLAGLGRLIAQRMKLTNLPGPTQLMADQFGELQKAGRLFITVEYRGASWHMTGAYDKVPPTPLGVAIDVGTTTVALLLVNMNDGQVVANTAGFNRQMHLGDDVITRINLCSTDHAMLERLQQAVVRDTIERLITRALAAAGASDNQICAFTVAANTTMLHLLAGVDPTPLGFAPFTAPFLERRLMHASQVHLHLSGPVDQDDPAQPSDSKQNNDGAHEDMPDEQAAASVDPAIHLLPSAAAYIGADLTAGIFSSGLMYDAGPSLLVDVGTNGEIILKVGDKMYGCATAAGPAFEGARLVSGMRAGQGAISRVRIEAEPLAVHIQTIGQVKPTGICGSAYVDFLAQARKAGLLTPTGRLEEHVPADWVAAQENNGKAFRVAYGHGKESILISESDIASLMQAKGAIAAGILTLLRRANVLPEQIKRLYLAGGFGMHIDIANAIDCGLLPGFTPQQVQVVGNTSLAGAYLSLLDSGVMDELSRIAKGIEVIELNLDPEFEMCYIDQLQLP